MKLWFKFVFVVVFSKQLNCYIPLFQMIIENLMSFLHSVIILMYNFLSFADVDDDYDEDGEQVEEGYHDLIDTSMKQIPFNGYICTCRVLYVKLLWLYDFSSSM